MVLNYKLALMSLIVALIVSCERQTDFEAESLPPTHLLHGYVDPNFGIRIFIAKAISTSDIVQYSDLQERNAKVEVLSEQGQVFEVLHKGDGNYERDTIGMSIAAGKRYKLHVRIPDYDLIESGWMEVPPLIRPDSLLFGLDGGMNGNARTASGLLQFTYSPTTGDCVLIRSFGLTSGRLPESEPLYTTPLNNVCDVKYKIKTVAVPSTCFESNPTFRCLMNANATYFFRDTTPNIEYEKFRIAIGLSNGAYYDFLSSLNQPEEWEYALFQPIPTYTNLKNCWGVFYTSNTTSVDFDL
jgi:hypothetical protein